MKNLCAKTRKVNEPYEVWRNDRDGWEWRVLKKWQADDKETGNPYARWFCAVKSSMTHGTYDMGDVYVAEIKSMARKVNTDVVILEKW